MSVGRAGQRVPKEKDDEHADQDTDGRIGVDFACPRPSACRGVGRIDDRYADKGCRQEEVIEEGWRTQGQGRQPERLIQIVPVWTCSSSSRDFAKGRTLLTRIRGPHTCRSQGP